MLEAAANYFYEVPNVAVRYTRQEVGPEFGYMRSVSNATWTSVLPLSLALIP